MVNSSFDNIMTSLPSAKNAESVILLKKTEPEALSASDEANFYQESLTSFTRNQY